MTIAAIVLAAGGSTRLGRPKQLVEYDGEMLLARAVRLAKEAGASPVVVVLGAEFEAITAAVDLSGATVVRNENWALGIASSIQEGLREAESGVDGVLVMTCDQPRLTAGYLREMFREFSREEVIASVYAGTRGVPAIFPRVAFAQMYALRGDMGARVLLKAPPWKVVEVSFPGGEVDVDTPEDLGKLEDNQQ